MDFGICWLIAASLTAIVFTVYDKRAARRRPRHRVPERQLWLIALLGGSAAMLVTMWVIRHKTRHPSFMWGLPLMLIAQAVLGYFILR